MPKLQLIDRGNSTTKLCQAVTNPRIHFALVCASNSCPPIDVYTDDNLDEELDLSARTFLNGGGVILDLEHNIIRLSKMFDWYDRDFGSSDEKKYVHTELSNFIYSLSGDSL